MYLKNVVKNVVFFTKKLTHNKLQQIKKIYKTKNIYLFFYKNYYYITVYNNSDAIIHIFTECTFHCMPSLIFKSHAILDLSAESVGITETF